MASRSSKTESFKRTKSCGSNFRFEIDYSKSKDLWVGDCISSRIFTACGYNWVLEFYPQGYICENKFHASIFLGFKSDANGVTVEYSFKLLSKTGNFVTICQDAICTFSDKENWSPEKFISKNEIKDLYCEKEFLVISCGIRVLSEPKMVENYPGGLFEHIGKLWEKGERFDVSFEVEGESIYAHRFMLAARSPVLEALLFGPIAEAKVKCIKIDEMKPEVFKALLHFVYTDQLPINESNDDETLLVELLQGLFVAANRYALEKLVLLCEEQLAENLSVDTVVTTLLLADQHSCVGLKRKCLEFASDPKNLPLVALKEEYLHIMSSSPSLFAELGDKLKSSPRFAKKPRTGYGIEWMLDGFS